jgi:hypothetical protein
MLSKTLLSIAQMKLLWFTLRMESRLSRVGSALPCGDDTGPASEPKAPTLYHTNALTSRRELATTVILVKLAHSLLIMMNGDKSRPRKSTEDQAPS